MLALNPFGYWPMDDAAGVGHWTDISGNGRNTTTLPDQNCFPQVTGLIATSADTAERNGGGPTVMHSQGTFTLPALTALSWMCWIQTTDTTATRRLWGCGTGSAASQQTFDIILTAGTVQFTIYSTDNTFSRVSSAGSLSDGKTHFLVGVWNGTTLTGYIDGASIGSTAAVKTPLTGSVNFGLNVAINFLSGGSMTGTYDEAALFVNTALSAGNVTTLFNTATTT